MAASVLPDAVETLRLMRSNIQLNQCANCFVFGWEEAHSESLQQCGRCKLLHYCSEECQKEHWALVHKAHCKKLASARQSEELGKEPVGVYSQHPFPHS